MNVTKVKGLLFKERLQCQVFIGLSIGVFGLVGIGCYFNNFLFQRFLGKLNPLLVFLIVIVIGFILLSFFLSQDWFAISNKENLKGLLPSSGLAALFGVIIILFDLKVVFPADQNILFPESLLFYPAIGFLVEILFHVLPLSVLLVSLTSISKNISFKNIIWICILIVSLLEPTFQSILAPSQFPLWATAYVFLHVLLINLFSLLIFKRYDFISMYSFRLVYYVFWHIGWGYIRLKLLF